MRSIEPSRVRAVRHVIIGLLVTCGLLAGSPALVAHHAGTMFSEDRTKELTGTVKEFQFTNPHSWIQVLVETTPGAPPQEWSIEWGSPNQLSRQGIRPSTFKFGTKVTVRVRPMRDGSPAGSFIGAKFDDGKTVGRWE
jgi:uncharacterized protein DUF6152